MQSEDTKNGKNLFALAPYLLVSDVIVAAEYYRDKLGFQIGPYARYNAGDPPYFTMVHRDGFHVQLRAAAGDLPRSNKSYVNEACDIYFFAKDVDLLFNEFKSRQAIIAQEPMNKYYQMREILVQDHSGYVLGFATPIPPPSQ
jgi:uncharacterized glyoxalase superfamily protein PhnB